MADQKLYAEKEFPCIQNSLLDEETGDIVVMVYTSEESDLPAGLWLSTEGFYEMVFAKSTISLDDVQQSLIELQEISGVEYEL